MRQRPGGGDETGPLRAACVSRVQWRLRATSGGAVEVENAGRLPLLQNGERCAHALARPGDVLGIGDEALFLVLLRPPRMPSSGVVPELLGFEFGRAGAFGIIGESAAAWHHRRQLALAAGRRDHVLLTGASGVSDLFALGVWLYETLSGRAASVLSSGHVALSDLEWSLPFEVALLVDQLLSIDPGARPASAAEVAARLRAAFA